MDKDFLDINLSDSFDDFTINLSYDNIDTRLKKSESSPILERKCRRLSNNAQFERHTDTDSDKFQRSLNDISFTNDFGSISGKSDESINLSSAPLNISSFSFIGDSFETPTQRRKRDLLRRYKLKSNTDAHLNSTTNSTPHTKAIRDSTGVTNASQTTHSKHHVWLESQRDQGPFYGLPSSVSILLEKLRRVTKLYDWQHKCLCLANDRSNLLYSLPTSGGKTLVAELLIMRQLVCRHTDCMLVLPYVAIVQEKIRALSPFAMMLGFVIAEYASTRGPIPPPKRRKRRTLYICTIEKAIGLVSSLIGLQRLADVALVVIDEVHMLGDGDRGATLEILITEIKCASPHTQLIAMSATIGNIGNVAKFLRAKMYTEAFRPVTLREHVLVEGTLLEITGADGCAPEDLFTQRKQLSLDSYSPEQRRQDPDGLGLLVAEVVPQASCLVFCATKNNCYAVAKLICLNLSRGLLTHNSAAKKSLCAALQHEMSDELCPVLAHTLPYGVAYHHSGLTNDERRLLEEAYLEGTLCCLCCTSTLAAGVNLPAKRVILRSPFIGTKFLTRTRYKQMVGRAGRTGIDDSGESVLIFKRSFAKQVGDMLTSPMERCRSSLLDNNEFGLSRLIMYAVSLGLVRSKRDIRELLDGTLLGIEAADKQNSIDLDSSIDSALDSLQAAKLLTISHSLSAEFECDDKKSVEHAWECCELIKICPLGLAAVNSNVDIRCVPQLYSDLQQALPALSLRTQLHLLYLATPYDSLVDIHPSPSIYLDAFSSLTSDEVAVAHLIGVSERHLITYLSGATMSSTAHRFYITLILYRLLKQEKGTSSSFNRVAHEFGVQRGLLQHLTHSASSFAIAIMHFCRHLQHEFWAFAQLFEVFSKHICAGYSAELSDLLLLPAVKQSRARALMAAGYKELHQLANAKPRELSNSVDHLPQSIAKQIIDSAKMILLERAELLQEEADCLLDNLSNIDFHHNPGIEEIMLSG